MQLCFSRKSVEEVFVRADTPVRGNSSMDDLPNIGPYLRQRLLDQNISTINEFLEQASAYTTPTSMMRFCSELVYNAHNNQCVNDPENDQYHAADINICGYNTLIQVIRFAHTHQPDFATFGFARAFPCTFESRLRLRVRGTNPGSRHCVCKSQGQCTNHAQCRWVANAQACIPRGGGNEQAGFEGIIGANNHHRAQRKRNRNGN